jgi:hypothetical protein
MILPRHSTGVNPQILAIRKGFSTTYYREIFTILGYEVDGSEADYRQMGEMLTFMALRPR